MPYGEAISRKLHLVLGVSNWHYFDCGAKFAQSEDRFLRELPPAEPTNSEATERERHDAHRLLSCRRRTGHRGSGSTQNALEMLCQVSCLGHFQAYRTTNVVAATVEPTDSILRYSFILARLLGEEVHLGKNIKA
jgi:hypothetical protein